MNGSALRDLAVLYRIGARAHRVFRDVERSPRRADVVAQGASGTPTETIDRATEAEVIRALDDEGLDWNVVSEEAGAIDRGGRRTLVVDPVDGTANAVRNLPFTTVSLALGAGSLDGVETGLVRDFDRGTTYWAARGLGAYRDGQRMRTRPWTPGRETYFANLGRHATPRVAAWAQTGRRVRALGCASLEILLVAEGGADAYLFENDAPIRNLRVTDIAAAYRILLEAGGGIAAADLAAIDSLPLSLEPRTSVLAWGDAAWRAHGPLPGASG